MKLYLLLPRYWKSLFTGLIITAICLIPSSELKKISVFEIKFGDLIVHLVMFLVFSGLLFNDLAKFAFQSYKKASPIIISIFISFFLGLIIEALQYLLAFLNRSASLSDLIFDLIGALLGTIIAMLIKR